MAGREIKTVQKYLHLRYCSKPRTINLYQILLVLLIILSKVNLTCCLKEGFKLDKILTNLRYDHCRLWEHQSKLILYCKDLNKSKPNSEVPILRNMLYEYLNKE